jgi:CheY-like chemotaxis protein
MTDTPLSVLLVDDDRDACNVFQMIVEHYNLQLTIVEDAETAYRHLANHSPDVIVMDIFLPGIDGYQAYNYIRKHVLAPNSVVIATTAYYTSDTQREILSWGFSGYLPKPFDPATLVPYLEEVAGKRKKQQPPPGDDERTVTHGHGY